MPVRRLAAQLVLLAACAGGDGGTGGERATAPIAPTSHDSAGVTIDEYPADIAARAPLITVDTAPLFRAGEGSDSIDLAPFGDVGLLSDGGTVAVDRGRTQLLVFNADGSFRTTLGKPGEGPGEFRSINRMFVVPGDSIVAADVGPRVAIFTAAGDLARSFTVPIVSEFPTQHALAGRAAADRWFLAPFSTATNGPPEAMPNVDRPVSIGLVAESAGPGGAWDTLTSVRPIPQVRATMHLGGQAREILTVPLYSRNPSAVPVGQGELAIADGGPWEVRIYGGNGLARIIRAPTARLPVTAAMIDASVTGRVAAARRQRPDMPDSILVQIEQTFREQPVTDTLPAVSRLMPASEDVIWLVEPVVTGVDSLRATAISLTRGVIGRLELPDPGNVAALGPDRMVIRRFDPATGVITLVGYRLNMP